MKSHAKGRRAGFSLLEIILVVAIMLLAAAMAVPSFVRSFQGVKLRDSVRTVLMTNRYARNMAVLQQKQIAIIYNSNSGAISIVGVSSSRGAQARDAFFEGRSNPSYFEESESFAIEELMKRQLAEDVVIADFATVSGQEHEGQYWVNYYPSGLSDQYAIRLRDKRDRHALIEIDHLAGSAKITYE